MFWIYTEVAYSSNYILLELFISRSGAEHNEQIVAAGSTWKDLGIVSGGARHLDKASLAARLATFDRWPYDRPQAPKSLAEAGFFYTGRADQVWWL